MPIYRQTARIASIFATFAALAVVPLSAQSLSSGGLIATITDDRGTPLRGVTVTLERRGAAFRIVETDAAGQAILASIPIGRYNVLAEQLGFQPVRAIDATVVTGGVSRLTIQLVRRPPPITTVVEQPAEVTTTSASTGQALDARALDLFARRRDATDATHALSSVDAPRDGRDGFAASAGGQTPASARLMVDGVEETLLRHPGLPGDASSAPIWSRDGIDQALVTWLPSDVEFRSAPGTLLSLTSKRGESRFTVNPYVAFSSAQFGGAAADNPADSAASSFEAGITLGGPLKGDTAGWFVRADYRQLAEPTADPFVIGTTDPTAGILAAAEANGGVDASSWLAPTVRRWEGGSALGRIDWRFGKTAGLGFRVGAASWNEDNSQAGVEAVNGAGARLEASDFSSALALVISNEHLTSESRIGFRNSNRDWFGAAIPFTGFVSEGIAIGGAGTLPGLFKESAFEVNEALTIPSGMQTVKVGANFQHRNVTYDWLPGSAGRYDFGGVGGFAASNGAFYQAFRSGDAPEIGVARVAFFLEDALQLTPDLQIFGGIRAETSALPTDVVELSQEWNRVSGLRNDFVPVRKAAFSPRGGFSYALDKSGRTVLRAEAGLLPVQMDLVSFAEIAQYDGDVSVRRATGTLAWPGVGAASTAPIIGPSITFYDAGARQPTSFKSEASITHDFGKGSSISLTAGYGHLDYALRRSDANLAVAPASTSNDGRSIWGTLEQYGALITPTVGSNRRFSDIDMAYGLTSTGYSDFASVTVAMERRVTRGLQVQASYTYSETDDNLVGQLSADPADRLSPFPDAQGLNDWDSGRSDLDIPHRVAATLEYRATGSLPLSIAARFRFRSGLPYTPGFQRGVDANGDGSSANDPAFLGSGISGMTGLQGRESCLAARGERFAERNSCRDPGVSALDLRGHLGLGGSARHVALTVDLFNLVGTETGLYDHAAVLVNPAGAISVDGAGHTVLPLLANQNFGQLLVRRGEGRMLRVGIRVEN